MPLESKEPFIECVFLVSSQTVNSKTQQRILKVHVSLHALFSTCIHTVTETRPGNYFCFSAWYLFCLAVQVLSVVSKVIYLAYIIRNVCGDDLQANIQYSHISYFFKRKKQRPFYILEANCVTFIEKPKVVFNDI